jgi:FecR protein
MRTKRPLFALVLILLSMPALFILSARQNPLTGLEDKLKQEAAEKALGTLLNDQLPLNLDAKTVYPTVSTLPGAPFQPKALQLTASDTEAPLPPGDYKFPVEAFCTEYSIHRPGNGIAYEMAPMQGKAATAISALLWRGTVQNHRNPSELQAVAWAIQSGLRYGQMPQSYQTVINVLIPEYINEFSGDFVESAEDTYTTLAKSAKLPPLDQLLAGMGKPGELMLSAERQRAALTRQNTTDQLRTQTLFAGQDTGVTTPLKATAGPWTERIPGVAYMRYTIVGGNLAINNTMEIRIMPQAGSAANATSGARLVNASYRAGKKQSAPAPTSISALMQGAIGYPVGAGAQDLVPVPVVASPAPVVGTLTSATGTVQICDPGGVCKTAAPGDAVSMGDTILTSAGGRAYISFIDNTLMTLSSNSKLVVDDYTYDPNNNASNRSSFSVLQGAFVYVSGLIGSNKDAERLDTMYGCLGIRGTKFIMRANGAEIDLIEGAVATGANPAAPHTQFNAPVKIMRTAGGAATSSPLTQAEFDAITQQLFPPQGATAAIQK